MLMAIEQEQRLNNLYPGLLGKMKNMDSYNDKMRASSSYMQAFKVSKDKAIDDCMIAIAVSKWQKSRAIYSIDYELQQELLEQTKRIDDVDKLPADIIKRLPYDCISVECKPMVLSARDRENGEIAATISLSGRSFIFVAEPCVAFSHEECLVSMVETTNGEMLTYFMPIRATINDSVSALMEFFKENYDGETTEEMTRFELHVSLFAMQIVLYLQAMNADIQVRPSPARKKSAKKSPAASKEPKPAKQYDVGVRVGTILRKYKYESSDSPKTPGAGAGIKKRPHARRGHWHHYWQGKHSEPENRKLVLRWVEPVFVGGEPKEATLFKLKK